MIWVGSVLFMHFSDPLIDATYCPHRTPFTQVLNATGGVIAYKPDCIVEEHLRIHRGCTIAAHSWGDEINCNALENMTKPHVRFQDIKQ